VVAVQPHGEIDQRQFLTNWWIAVTSPFIKTHS
jgi:hypothetical protein